MPGQAAFGSSGSLARFQIFGQHVRFVGFEATQFPGALHAEQGRIQRMIFVETICDRNLRPPELEVVGRPPDNGTVMFKSHER
jgi:hypothetical protein